MLPGARWRQCCTACQTGPDWEPESRQGFDGAALTSAAQTAVLTIGADPSSQRGRTLVGPDCLREDDTRTRKPRPQCLRAFWATTKETLLARPIITIAHHCGTGVDHVLLRCGCGCYADVRAGC